MKLALASLLLVPVQLQMPPPTIPEGAAICTDTHCIVNASDWAQWQEMAEENKALKAEVKTVKCASVTVIEPPKGW